MKAETWGRGSARHIEMDGRSQAKEAAGAAALGQDHIWCTQGTAGQHWGTQDRNEKEAESGKASRPPRRFCSLFFALSEASGELQSFFLRPKETKVLCEMVPDSYHCTEVPKFFSDLIQSTENLQSISS